ncbi:MAG TPA: DinB family protein, partial [Ktedonobacteraceae bacterium]|nr:DinB family protein [Ktedonobacteraceae bacterium]
EIEWYERQKRLWDYMQSEELESLAAGLQLFLDQHAQVHMTDGKQSLAESTLVGLSDEHWRLKLGEGKNSIAWLIWHNARIEDVTFNLLVVDGSQVFDDWFEQLGFDRRKVGTGMGDEEVLEISSTIHLPALREYWAAVGRRTQQVARTLDPVILKERLEPRNIQRLFDEGAVTQNLAGLAQWWSERTRGELLFQPVSRHAFTHLHEIRQMRETLLAHSVGS